jgi:DinB superfamily
MPDASLLILLDEFRGKTVTILQSVQVQDSLWAPPALHNTIVWHAGHCYFLLASLTMRAIGHNPKLPTKWDMLFSWDSHPQLVPAECWPPLGVIIESLQNQHERMRLLAEALTPEQLEQPLAFAPGNSVRYAVIHALHDEACHCGEIHRLRKLRAVG